MLQSCGHCGGHCLKSISLIRNLAALVEDSSNSYCYHNAHSVCWKWYRLPLHRQRSYRKYRILYSCSCPRSFLSYRYVIRTGISEDRPSLITRSPGIFKRIVSLANSQSLRVICLSRRGYEESTPYSADELKIIHQGSDVERANFLHNEGKLIALFVDRLIQLLSLPQKGGVTVGAWSLASAFTVAMRASINDLPDNTKQRLKAYTRGFIIYGLSLRCSFMPKINI